jgi:predicted HicB family RNase H-like nuclease
MKRLLGLLLVLGMVGCGSQDSAVDTPESLTANQKKRGRPATGHSPKRTFRMADREYNEVAEAASWERMSTSAWIRKTLYRVARHTG